MRMTVVSRSTVKVLGVKFLTELTFRERLSRNGVSVVECGGCLGE